MRTLTKIVAVTASVAALFLWGTPVWAFHDGGVAYCTGCHSMHSSPSSSHLLMKSDAGSTCLRCHERTGDAGPSSYHISTPASELLNATDIPKQRTPGGDFGWLRQNLTALSTFGSPVNNQGFTRGHNIIAMDNSYTFVDGPTAPGGTMPASELTCISCHDPHSRARRLDDGSVVYPTSVGVSAPIEESGSYGFVPGPGMAAGVYRLLGGSAYQAFDSGPSFPGVPAAVVPNTYNRTEAATQTRVAYGHGTTSGYVSWGKWCSTCHTGMHSDTASNLVHVVDAQLNANADIYNSYIKTGDLTGSSANSYTSLVPFAKNTNDVATLALQALNDDSDLTGPAGTDRIGCLSCHRAHASGWRFGMRWNSESEFLTLADGTGAPVYPGVDAGMGNQGQYNRGYTVNQMKAAYYDRPPTVFAAAQRQYCNKCHAKD
ncbi:MAG TPA: cytochrome c3 family protein [Candidatus Polarisedimenticolia bacterium]|nr:cytochrome c3 family protein [Candidatus Polarisedimenticolia bacterium]